LRAALRKVGPGVYQKAKDTPNAARGYAVFSSFFPKTGVSKAKCEGEALSKGALREKESRKAASRPLHYNAVLIPFSASGAPAACLCGVVGL
jgi:hypothetical protein